MGRYRKTLINAVNTAKEFVDSEKLTIEKASKKAADLFGEDEQKIITILNNEVVIKKNPQKRSYKRKIDKAANEVKEKNPVQSEKVTNEKEKTKEDIKSSNKYEYNGPADVICLNGEISTIHICELITANDENEAKEKLYEKLFNNRLPIFIKGSSWSKCIHQV